MADTDLPEPPEAARTAFEGCLDRVVQYGRLLASAGVERGLIGPREVERLWQRHLLNCVLPVRLVPEGARVADVGSGAGLPGLVWAIARPDLHVTLIEPLLRRSAFLVECVEQLELDNVQVLRARAEDVPAADAGFDGVTARAVAALPVLATWTVPLVAPGGSVWALKGRTAKDELDEARVALARTGVVSSEIVEISEDGVDEPTTVVVLGVGVRPVSPAMRRAAPNRGGPRSAGRPSSSRSSGRGGGPGRGASGPR